ncbi:ABC transporter permease [Salibacterium halotolerans]|uniref:Iron(III) transport system permease protein n=1 Tax=Salibacterium halotolerans TaxID=1884432 RepID=A0A1I5KZY6_9BACI|nr:iron ABC transporter permease [Salibacterium halotolerans]SFO90644.1 iron(III) transport system permease protein [Salibacterium halotolerans]
MDNTAKKNQGGPASWFSALSAHPVLWKRMMLAVTLVVLILFFVLPIVRLIWLSFTEDAVPTWQHYNEVLSDAGTWTVIQNTFWMVLGSTIMTLLLGVFMAWLITYSDIRAKQAIHVMVMLPFIIPSYIITLSWTQLFRDSSWFSGILQWLPGNLETPDLYTLPGMIFMLGLSNYPLVYLFTVAVLRKIPQELLSAARASGSGKWTVFRKITLPLALPGITGGGLLAFLANLDNFGIPAFLGIPGNITVLSTAIYQEVVGFGPSAFARAAVLSVLLGVIALLGTFLQWMLLRKSRELETAHEETGPRFRLGVWRFPAETAVWVALVFISFVPLSSMVSSSLLSAYGVDFSLETITFSNYSYILFENEKTQGAIGNSLMLALWTAVTALIAGTILAYYRVRRPSTLTRSTELITGLPYALPGIVLALAMIFTWMEPIPGWNPGIYGSIGILMIAYITRFMILQVRGSMTALMQVDISMEEASHVFGAKGLIKWRKIMLPLLLPGLISGTMLVFLTSFTELTVSSLLMSAGNETIGVTIFDFEQAGYTHYSTAFSTVVVVLMLMVIGSLMLAHHLWKKKVVKT